MKRGKGNAIAKPATFTNNLEDIRVQQGLTLAELERLTGVSDRRIRDIERGVGRAKRSTLHKIVNGLNDYLRERGKREYAFEEVFPPNQPQTV